MNRKHILHSIAALHCTQPVSHELLSDALETSGFRAIEASDDRGAVPLIEQNFPDFQMPSTDGFAVLQVVRAQDESGHLPVIAFTAFAMENDRQQILAAGFDSYVSKPISISEVRRQVEQLLGDDEDGDGA